jgi:hypothetical protein
MSQRLPAPAYGRRIMREKSHGDEALFSHLGFIAVALSSQNGA